MIDLLIVECVRQGCATTSIPRTCRLVSVFVYEHRSPHRPDGGSHRRPGANVATDRRDSYAPDRRRAGLRCTVRRMRPSSPVAFAWAAGRASPTWVESGSSPGRLRSTMNMWSTCFRQLAMVAPDRATRRKQRSLRTIVPGRRGMSAVETVDPSRSVLITEQTRDIRKVSRGGTAGASPDIRVVSTDRTFETGYLAPHPRAEIRASARRWRRRARRMRHS